MIVYTYISYMIYTHELFFHVYMIINIIFHKHISYMIKYNILYDIFFHEYMILHYQMPIRILDFSVF